MKRAIGLLLLAAGIGQAQEKAEELLWRCKGSTAEQVACTAYLLGFMDGLRVQSTLSKAKQLVCQPADGVSGDQARRVVIKWIESNPEHMHQSARIAVTVALQTAFPCP